MRDAESGNYIFSNSEMQTFKDCRRKWWLAYHRRLEPISTRPHTARDAGTLVHEALRRYYRNNQDRINAIKWLDDERENDIVLCSEYDVSKVHAGHDLARVVVEGYFTWLEETGADAFLQVEAVETAITIPTMISGTLLTGKIDLRVRDISDDRRVILDHKTVPNFVSILQTLHLNEQGPLYDILQREGLPDAPKLHGVVWNMLRKVKRGPKSKPPYYARYTLLFTDAGRERFWRQLHGQMRTILDVEQALNEGADHNAVAYPSPGPDCTWKCPFFAVCGLFNDPDYDAEGVLEANYLVGNPLARYDDDNTEGAITAQ